jgi:hypothetical protein
MANYHNRFILNLASKAKPITALLHRSTNFEWTSECNAAWAYIRDNLAQDHVIRGPDWQKPFMINPSASETVVASVLIQNDETGRAHPIYYASQLLTPCELRYSPSKKSAVALLFSYMKFKHYLLSSPHPITVQCEKEGLKQVIQQTEPFGRTARFIASLQQYDLIFQKIQGQRALHAKTLLELGEPPDSKEGELSDEADCYTLVRMADEQDFGYGVIIKYLMDMSFPLDSTSQQRKDIKRKSIPFYSNW